MNTVLHVIETPGSGGAETIFVELARGLNAGDWGSVAAVPGPGWVYDAVRRAGLEPQVTSLGKRTLDLGYLFRLVRLIRRHRVALVQTHLLGGSVYGCLAGALCRVPVVATLHGSWDLKERFAAVKLWLISRLARRIVFVSDALRREVTRAHPLPAEHLAVIPNGISVETFRPGRHGTLRAELGLREEDFLVGAVGNIRPDKAYDVFLQAAALVLRSDAAARFVVVGEGSGRLFDELRSLRDQLGLQSALHFAGFRGDLDRVLGDLDVYVSSSRAEGFSLTTVQAMACGVPAVATRSGGPEEILTPDVTGLLVDVGAADELAGAILRLRQDRNLRQRLALAGRREIEERFSLGRMLVQYEQLYDQCLCSP